MKLCLKCLTEYRDDCESCSDCGGPLTAMREAEVRMRNKMKHPIKLITLEDTKEKELLKALLSEQNIIYYALQGESTDGLEEHDTEDIYVEENRLEYALPIVDSFQRDLVSIREFAEAKARMIKPVLLFTLEVGEGVNGWDLVCFLEERNIQSCCETERYYEAGARTASYGSMCGGMVIKEHIFVDERYLEEAMGAAEEFFEEKRLQKERDKMSENTDEGDEEEETDEEERTEYTDCEFIPDRFLKWLHGVLDKLK